ncbi:MAG: GNAT family N-acetyltransferase [Minwuia sp.]|uniref:GNAT family N-acetyltransferase n=1 Tax=Minwuia sp. TaxID=2493630 RepID=UPI003A8BFE29
MTRHLPAIRKLDADELEQRLPDLAKLLRDCVQAGASVNFILPFEQADAERFWRNKVTGPVRNGVRLVLIAEAAGRIAGTVQLDWDTPPNQTHRADVTKLLVHPDFRRRGIARQLMAALETEAAALHRSLLTLDTRTGDDAEPLYLSMGYQVAGQIPGFSRDPFTDVLDATTLMYKQMPAA